MKCPILHAFNFIVVIVVISSGTHQFVNHHKEKLKFGDVLCGITFLENGVAKISTHQLHIGQPHIPRMTYSICTIVHLMM